MIAPNWIFNAAVVGNHDGDTLSVRVDQGFGVNGSVVDVRLKDCWAAELTGRYLTPSERARGEAARDHLRSLLPPGTPVVIQTAKATRHDGGGTTFVRSFTRYVATVWLYRDGAQQNVSELMVAAGHATRSRPAAE